MWTQTNTYKRIADICGVRVKGLMLTLQKVRRIFKGSAIGEIPELRIIVYSCQPHHGANRPSSNIELGSVKFRHCEITGKIILGHEALHVFSGEAGSFIL